MNSNKKNKISALDILLFFLVLTLVTNLWGISYTTGDDLVIAVDRYWQDGILSVGINASIVQGRFYQVIPYTIAQIPSLFEPFLMMSILRVTSSLLMIFSFYILVTEVLGKHMARFALVIWMALIHASGKFSPFHLLPLWFNLNITLFFFSLYLYKVNLVNSKSLLLPNFIFILSLLFYESFLIYFPIFPIFFYIYQYKQNYSKRSILKDFFKRNLALTLGVFSYLIIFYIYRVIFYFDNPNASKGIELNISSLNDILNTIISMSTAAILFLPSLPSFDQLLDTSLMFFSLGIGIYIYILLKFASTSFDFRNLSGNILIYCTLIYLAIAPNFLYGFTERYRQWALSDPHYIGSFYSSFPISIIIAFVVLDLFKENLIDSFDKTIAVFIGLFFCLCAFGSYAKTQSFFEQRKIDANRWKIPNEIMLKMHNTDFNILCLKNFINHPSEIRYWEAYFSLKLDKKVRLVTYTSTNEYNCDGTLEYSGIDKQEPIFMINFYNSKMRIENGK